MKRARKTSKAADRKALVARGVDREELKTYERDASTFVFSETVARLIRRAAEKCNAKNLAVQIEAQEFLQARAVELKKTKAVAFYAKLIELLDTVRREKAPCPVFSPAEGQRGRDGICVCRHHQEEHELRDDAREVLDMMREEDAR